MRPSGGRILVTGAAGYLGGLLVRDLLQADGVDLIVGLDLDGRGLPHDSHFRFFQRDVASGFEDIVRDLSIDTIVHLAFPVEHLRDRDQWDRISRTATTCVLAAADAPPVRRIVMTSSTVVYGGSVNPGLRDESNALSPTRDYSYAVGKASMEEITSRWNLRHPGCRVAVVRPCIVLGPHTNNYMVRAFFQQTPFVEGCDPRIQFLHETDFTAAMRQLTFAAVAGTFNVTPSDGGVYRSEIHRLFGMPIEFQPYSTVRRGLESRWKMGCPDAVEPAIIELIAYHWCASNGLLRRTVGWSPTYSSLDTLLDYSKAKRRAAKSRFRKSCCPG